MQGTEGKIYSEFVCTNAMKTALVAPFPFECGMDVEKVRQGCYRVRRRCRARGDKRFDGLRFRIVNGTELLIFNLGRKPDFTAKDILNGVIELMKKDRRNDA